MALKNQPITIAYSAWNSFLGAPQSGDVGNHALRLIQDGTEAAPTNAPAADDAARPGTYTLALTAADMNFNCVAVCGKSSTANVHLFGPTIVTERGVLPAAAPAATGGLPIVGSAPLSNLDAAVSSRLPTAGYAAPPTAAAIAASILADPAYPIATAAGGVVAANVAQWLGAAPPTPVVPGVPITDNHYMDGLPDTDTAQGGTSTTITLGADESSVDGFYAGQVVAVIENTGASQARIITAYIGATKVATVHRPWLVIPDSTSVYTIGGLAEISIGQLLPAPRALDSVPDASMELSDALWAAIVAIGRRSVATGTSETFATPGSGTPVRTAQITTQSNSPFGSNFPVTSA
jgi:hypothetical protein